jgi:osmotically-inducible protein OsmY
MRLFAGAGLLLLGLAGCSDTSRPSVDSANRGTRSEKAEAANNTGVNVRDRDATVKTPIDQNENKSDIDITAAIRKRVVASKMSVNAQNVKIMTQDGKVTLRGPVKSTEEKQQIEEIAFAIAGKGNVENKLDIE